MPTRTDQPVLSFAGVGVNEYDASPLQGTGNDIRNLVNLLNERGGWTIRTLFDRDATSDHIEQFLEEWVRSLGPRDLGLGWYSGHGGSLAGGRDEPDQRTECIFGCDLRPIPDDRLAAILGGVNRRAQLLMGLDCCHAYTGTRNAPLGVEAAGDSFRQGKMLDPAEMDISERARRAARKLDPTARRRTQVVKRLRSLPIVELSACLPWEVTYDARINGIVQGCYTRAVLDAWKELQGEGISRPTMAQWAERIATKLPSPEYPTHPGVLATPSLLRWLALEAGGRR